MKRPSRRLRESVATMLKNGRFFAPPRAKRITTILFPEKLCWAEKADDYSAKCRAAASLDNNRRALPAESAIIAHFWPGGYGWHKALWPYCQFWTILGIFLQRSLLDGQQPQEQNLRHPACPAAGRPGRAPLLPQGQRRPPRPGTPVQRADCRPGLRPRPRARSVLGAAAAA